MCHVEHAKTDRSCCRVCGGPIAKGALRLGRPEKKRGSDIIGWNHVECTKPLPADDQAWESVEGWFALDDESKRSLINAREEYQRRDEGSSK